MIAKLMANLISGFRLLTLARVAPADFTATVAQVLLLLGLHLGLRALADMVRAWPPSEMLGYGVGLALLPLVIVLALTEAVARWRRVPAAIACIEVAILAAGICVQIIWIGITSLMPWGLLPLYSGFVLSVAMVFLWGVAGYRALRLIGGQGMAVSALFGVLLPVAMIATGMLLGSFPIFLSGPRG